jgi:hypothetical protein
MEKMGKMAMVLIISMLFVTAAAFADEPIVANGGGGGGCPGPSCIDRDASGYIDAGNNQWQGDSQWRDPNSNVVGSNFNMNQNDWAHGEGTNGFTGEVALGQVQGRTFDTTVDLGHDAYVRSWGSGVQNDFKEATLTEHCNTLDATGGQHFNANTYTDQANSGDHHFMTGNQYVNAGANVSLQGGKYGTGAQFTQSGVSGYEHVDKSGNWQNGFTAISTSLNVPTRTAPPQD